MRLGRRPRQADIVAITPLLLIGSAPRHGAAADLRRRGIKHVVDLRAESHASADFGASVVVQSVPIVDRMALPVDELHELATSIVTTMGRGEVVLVHCEAGVGRTAMVACAVLMTVGYPLDEAYRIVHERRRSINPTDAQLAALRGYEETLRAGQEDRRLREFA